MSKEMMIVFVYDTECCQHEADDPVAAVLYFHPSWVSDVQKISLVGQLMGTAHFLRDTFGARPRVISLQSGRFVLQEFGRFLLAVGTDRNLPGSTLQHRAELLASLVRFFHRDIQTMHDQFAVVPPPPAATGPSGVVAPMPLQPYKSLSEKLYHVFETYLPILQHSGNIFQNMPISRLPKSASNIFLDAMQTLQSCQQTQGVLGGAIFFNNKVLATQLTPELTKNLVLTDPYRIKSTAESLAVHFHIPVGVQLMVIYMPSDDHRKLRVDAQRAQTVTNQSAGGGSTAKGGSGSNGSNSANNASTPAGIIPFQFKKKIKRDKSIIFTNIPEEAEAGTSSNSNGAAVVQAEEAREDLSLQPAAVAPPVKPLSIAARPNHLPLRFKNITSKDLPESGFSSINFDESDSFPQFIGKTSVCSTPMTEMKVLHGAVLSICAPTAATTDTVDAVDSSMPVAAATKTPPANGAFDELIQSKRRQPSATTDTIRLETRRHSLSNVHESLKKIRLAMRPFGHGLVKLGKTFRDRSPSPGAPLTDDDDEFDDVNIDDLERTTYRTITDPMYPVFNSAGAPISKCLFQEFLAGVAAAPDSTGAPATTTTTTTTSAGGSSTDQVVPQVAASAADDPLNMDGFDGALRSLSPAADESPGSAGATAAVCLPASTPNRSALSLPLKSLTLDLVNTTTGGGGSVSTAAPAAPAGLNMFEVPAQRKKLAGIQLTPLMTKLSILAMADERSSGFSSWDTTPGCGLDGGLVSTPAGCDRPFRRRSSTTRYEDLVEFAEEDEVDATAAAVPGKDRDSGAAAQETQSADGMQRCELFVCGQQNMTMLLVLDQSAGLRQELVQTMFETCVSRLTRIEASLSQTLSVNVDGDKADGSAGGSASYSFLSTDPHWDTLQRGGPWSAGDLLTLEHMRSDLRTADGKTDMVLRTDDAVVYGYQHGLSSVFYKQNATLKQGLPPPADAMGTVSTNAKRRLERDHSIILL